MSLKYEPSSEPPHISAEYLVVPADVEGLADVARDSGDAARAQLDGHCVERLHSLQPRGYHLSSQFKNNHFKEM